MRAKNHENARQNRRAAEEARRSRRAAEYACEQAWNSAAARRAAAEVNPEALASGKAWQKFATFEQGAAALCRISHSAEAAIRHNMPDGIAEPEWDERNVIAGLAINVGLDRPTGNGIDWGRCSLSINAHGVTYVTTGGLEFGWYVHPNWEYGANPRREEMPYIFYVGHPSGEFSPNSTLLLAALNEGWQVGVPPHLR